MTSVLGLPLPHGWSSSPLKHVTTALNRGSAPIYVEDGPVHAVSQAANQPGGLDWSRTRFHAYSGDPRKLKGYLQPGDVIINSTGTGTLGRVGQFLSSPDGSPCMADGHVTIARADLRELHPRFAYYWLASQPFQEYVYAALVVGATNQIELNRERLGEAPVPLPPLDEQRRIADFLDVETSHIDRIVAAREAQKSILKERELSLISETLSGGESPQGSRSTGMPWLPAIPADWKIGPVYAYFSTELGKMLNAERATGDRQRPYLRNANIHWYEIDVSDMATMSFDASETRRYSVAPGDLLVCEGGAGVAEAAVWNGEISDCYYQKSLHRVRRAGPVPVEWLMYWLRLAKHVGVFQADGNIATIPHLTGEQLREYRIPIPPDGDLRVAALNREVSDLLSLVGRLDQAQALLAARRQVLITAAVTGQLDVTTARPAHDRDL
ncbi:restriction endonuclease subunit S [Streptomyces sp. NPDC003007]